MTAPQTDSGAVSPIGTAALLPDAATPNTGVLDGARAPRSPAMVGTHCPICATDLHDREVYPMNFSPAALSADVFSARRLPDRLHYRMVRCDACGLLRSNPILDPAELAKLYAGSHFTYADEAVYTRKTYGAYLARALTHAPGRERLMEIGCGSGFFLEEALQQGFGTVCGVEPGGDAIESAGDRVRNGIRQGFYEPETFPADHFDVICAFQVFDHVPDPAATLAACRRHLKPGGVALFINHDSGALSARLLGELSPIVDIEHTALYDKRTMALLFERAGLEVLEVFDVANRYPVRYWAKLAPLPAFLKRPLLSWLDSSRLGDFALSLSAGNLGLIARKRVDP